MHKTLTVGVFFGLATSMAVWAQPGRTVRATNLLERGGLVITKPDGPRIIVLSTQGQLKDTELGEIAAHIQRTSRLPIAVRQVGASDGRKSAKELASLALGEGTQTVAAVVSVVSHEHDPALLVAPEERWAQVNVTALMTGAQDVGTVRERVQKEMWRATCYVMGAANSVFEHCVMRPVFNLADLDALPNSASPEPFARMAIQAKVQGVRYIRVATYQTAVREGWADKPTNDIQQAIWEANPRK